MKKILYVDMDNVLVDFMSGADKISAGVRGKHEKHLDDIPGIFGQMKPMRGAVESFKELSSLFDTYVLSTAPWENPYAWSDKLEWVKKHLGQCAYKRLIITHHKNLNMGDFLIDDRTANGVDKFRGEYVQFGSAKFPDWAALMKYMREKTN